MSRLSRAHKVLIYEIYKVEFTVCVQSETNYEWSKSSRERCCVICIFYEWTLITNWEL